MADPLKMVIQRIGDEVSITQAADTSLSLTDALELADRLISAVQQDTAVLKPQLDGIKAKLG